MDSYQLVFLSSDYDAYKTEYIGQSARQVQGQRLESMFSQGDSSLYWVLYHLQN